MLSQLNCVRISKLFSGNFPLPLISENEGTKVSVNLELSFASNATGDQMMEVWVIGPSDYQDLENDINPLNLVEGFYEYIESVVETLIALTLCINIYFI